MLMRPREGVVGFVSDVRVAEILKASDDSSFLLVAMLIISWDVDVAITFCHIGFPQHSTQSSSRFRIGFVAGVGLMQVCMTHAACPNLLVSFV